MRTRSSDRPRPSTHTRAPFARHFRGRGHGGPVVAVSTLTCLGLIAPTPALASPSVRPVVIEAVDVEQDGHRVVIRTSSRPKFSVFRLTAPFRILVDVTGGELGPGAAAIRGESLVSAITPRAFDDGATQIARVEIELQRSSDYEARAQGRSIIVEIGSHKHRAASEGARAKPSDKAASTTVLGRLRMAGSGARTVLRAPLSGATLSSDAVRMETLSEPSRLVIDLDEVKLNPKWQRVHVGRHGIRRARAAVRGEGTRVVLDMNPGADFPQVAVDVVGNQLEMVIEAPATLVLSAAPTPAPKETPPAPIEEADPVQGRTAPPAEAVAAPAEPSPVRQAASRVIPDAQAPAPSAHSVKNVRFEPKDGFYRLTVDFADNADDVRISRRGSEAAPALRVSGAKLPEALERTMDVTALAGEALSSVSTFMDGGDLVIAARILDSTEHRHWRKGRRLMWDFRSSKPRVLNYEADEGTASYSSEAARTAGTLAPSARRYTGRRISLDLKDADIQNVLRLLADVSKLNIVAADDVKGKITIKLRNVPWDQALDIILRAKQLDKTRNGNIIRVAPLTVLQKEEEIRLERLRAQVQLEPLTVRLIPVSYAVAADVRPQVQALLTERGEVNVDQRTNVLIVEDIATVLTKVERLVRTLDTQTPQVLIEARIVEARSNFSRELGVQWGGNASFSQNYGNQTGLSFPSNIRIAGGADDQQNQVTEGVLPNANYAVNLPAAVGAGGGGALGFVFGSLNSGTLVNLRLSAAEATGKVKIVSSPKIVTLDNKEAKILSGERVPITVITANGPTTRFIDANIELRVVPHVTQDGSILMQLKARKNELSDRIDFLGVPGILTKEAETQMIVRDGDTAVLGGLYRRNSQENEAYVPWIGKIPVLGWLFKNTSRQDSRDELLIFISPRIVNRSAALISPE